MEVIYKTRMHTPVGLMIQIVQIFMSSGNALQKMITANNLFIHFCMRGIVYIWWYTWGSLISLQKLMEVIN